MSAGVVAGAAFGAGTQNWKQVAIVTGLSCTFFQLVKDSRSVWCLIFKNSMEASQHDSYRNSSITFTSSIPSPIFFIFYEILHSTHSCVLIMFATQFYVDIWHRQLLFSTMQRSSFSSSYHWWLPCLCLTETIMFAAVQFIGL